MERIAELGAKPQDRTVLRGLHATLPRIESAFDAIQASIRPDDKLIVYIGGHGDPLGAGSIHIRGGIITSQRIGDFLSSLPTRKTFVVINSCYGGKFIQSLRPRCEAVVLTCTDSANIGWQQGLEPFWRALGDAAADTNGDGRVTVLEAFVVAHGQMLEEADRARTRYMLLGPAPDPNMRRVLLEDALSTPQLASFGQAKEEDFWVPVEPETVKPSANPPPPK